MHNMINSYYKRTILDRYDGWRVKDVDQNAAMLPYFLRTRIDSQCFFEERIDVERIEAFIKQHKEDMPDLTIMHVVIASMVRIMSQRPYVNRFIVHNKLYAHNDITISLVIKRQLADRGEETPIRPVFEPTDTLPDVVRRINEEIEATRPKGVQNSADKTSGALSKLPACIMRFTVGLIRILDDMGILPKAIHKASPWHTSAFITNVGSLGIGPIYHHLYEFGTCSFFVAMGKKEKRTLEDENGKTYSERFLGLRYVIDERVCDGHYYAVSMRLMRRLMNNPEMLLLPPTKLVMDDGVLNKKRKDNLIDKYNALEDKQKAE